MSYPTENYVRPRGRQSSFAKKKLIVTADDLGLTRRVNEAIEKAHREGVVTAASLMVTGRAFESAVDLLKENPSLDAGLHLNLTEGKPVSGHEQIVSLADSNGFRYHHPFELLSAVVRGRVSHKDLEKEIRAQIERGLTAGVNISHIDGHKHVHVLPQVFDLVCRIAPGYRIDAIRSTKQKTPRLLSFVARNLGSGHKILKQYFFSKVVSASFLVARSGSAHAAFATPCRFYGITQTGFLDIAAFTDILSRLEAGISEVMCHPGYVDEDLRRTPTRLHFQRERELELLTGREIRDLLAHAGVALVSYRDLRVCANRA